MSSVTGTRPSLKENLRRFSLDIDQYVLADQEVRSLWVILRMMLITPGFQFVMARRIQDMLYGIPLIGRLAGRVSWWCTCLVFSSEIAIAAEVAGGLYIPHPYGIVVGRCEIGPGVTILQNVTIGKLRKVEQGYPRLEADVYVGAGAVILGPVTVGRGAVIGANSLVRSDIPAGCLAVGSPARIIAAA